MYNPTRSRFMMSSAFALLLATSAAAQTPAAPSQEPPAAVEKTPKASADSSGASTQGSGATTERFLAAQGDKQMLSGEIIGARVRNLEDESIGKIEALLLSEDQRVIAGIVSVGGFLGIGATSVAVNWNEFQFRPTDKVAIVKLSREQLEAAPKFEDRQQQQARADLEQRRREAEQQRLSQRSPVTQ